MVLEPRPSTKLENRQATLDTARVERDRGERHLEKMSKVVVS